MKKIIFVLVAALASQSFAPGAFAAGECPKDVDALRELDSVLITKGDALDRAKASLDDIKQKLHSNTVRQIELYSGTVALLPADFFTFIMALSKTDRPSGSAWNAAFGALVVVEAGLVYLDVKTGFQRAALNRVLAEGEIRLTEAQAQNAEAKANITECYKVQARH